MSFESEHSFIYRSANVRTGDTQSGGVERSYTNFSRRPNAAEEDEAKCEAGPLYGNDSAQLEVSEDDILIPPPRSTGIHLKSQAETLNAVRAQNVCEKSAETEKSIYLYAQLRIDYQERRFHRYIRQPQPIDPAYETPARRSRPSRLPGFAFRPERSRPLPQQLPNLNEKAESAGHSQQDIAEQFRRAREQSEIVRRRLREYVQRREAEMAAGAEIERYEALLAAEQHERELQIRRMEQLTRMHRLQQKRDAEKQRRAQPPECAQAGLYKWRAEETKKRKEETRRMQEFEKARQQRKPPSAKKLRRRTPAAALEKTGGAVALPSPCAAMNQKETLPAPELAGQLTSEACYQDLSLSGVRQDGAIEQIE